MCPALYQIGSHEPSDRIARRRGRSAPWRVAKQSRHARCHAGAVNATSRADSTCSRTSSD